MRYTFFAAVLEQAFARPEDVVLEYPLNASNGRLDTHILPSDSRPAVTVEFKYFRPLPGQKNSPKTRFAGHVLSDLARLAELDQDGMYRLFVLLVTSDMAVYFRNPANRLNHFYELKRGETCVLGEDVVASGPTTLGNSLKHEFRGLKA